MTLLREDAGMSFMEFALIGALVLVVCLLLLLALRRGARACNASNSYGAHAP